MTTYPYNTTIGCLRGLAANELKSAAYFRNVLKRAVTESRHFGWPLHKEERVRTAKTFIYRARLLRAVRGFNLPA